MGFDDLARHMASRDGKKKLVEQVGDADQIVEEAARADRRMSRRRDLILGPLLLVGGIVVLLLNYLVLVDAADPTPNPHRPPSEGPYPIYFTVAAASAVIIGLRQTIRGATSTVKEAFEPEVTLRERRRRILVWGSCSLPWRRPCWRSCCGPAAAHPAGSSGITGASWSICRHCGAIAASS